MHASPGTCLMEQHLFTQPHDSSCGSCQKLTQKSFPSKRDLGLVERRVKHASPRSLGRPKGQVATRSFSLPWLRLVHILLQPSAPIHPLDQGFSILITWPINIQETLIPESGIQIQESLRARGSSCIFPFCSPISDIRAKLILWMNKQAKAPDPIIFD